MTIGDVAAEAGVSIATVSKVINDRYGVAARHVRAGARRSSTELGYESSLVARSLRSRRTNVIGILVADIEPFSAELLKGAGAGDPRASGYELIVYSGSGHGKEHSGWERRYVSRLSGTLTDGIILVTPTVVDVGDATPGRRRRPAHRAVEPAQRPLRQPRRRDHRHRAPHRARPPPDRVPRRPPRPRVGPAARAGLPRRRSAPPASRSIPASSASASYELETSEEPARQLLTLDDRPTAIFAANDLSAIQTMHVARIARAVACPDDVSVVGFDNIPESALTEPPLTTIDQSIQQMGTEAVRAARRPDRGHRPSAPGRSRCRPGSSSASPASRSAGAMTRCRRGPTPPTGTPRRPVGERVADLLARMTLEEKVAQLGSAWVFQLADGARARRRAGRRPAPPRLGQVTRISGASSLGARDAAALANAIQRHLVAETRLGIPAIVHEEICSG